jgi:hypothetical protein
VTFLSSPEEVKEKVNAFQTDGMANEKPREGLVYSANSKGPCVDEEK